MKKFKFKFQVVEKVREAERDKQSRVLALASLDVRKKEQEKKSLIEQLHNAVLDAKRQILEQVPNAIFQDISARHREQLRRDIAKKSEQLIQSKQKELMERKKLIEKQKAKMVMEKLRQKLFDEWKENFNKTETRDNDEISSNMWIHRRIDS